MSTLGSPVEGGHGAGDDAVLPGLPALLAEARAAALPVAGLMAIPPAGLDAAPYFALLAKIARDEGVTGLSMGMSDDYMEAIKQGSTFIRVGSKIFGARS